MKHVMSLLLVSLVTTAACVDNGPAQDPSSQISEPTNDPTGEATNDLTATGSGPKTNATCQLIWECDPICGRYQNGVLVMYPTNVLHNECDDGTDSVVLTHACFTEDCY